MDQSRFLTIAEDLVVHDFSLPDDSGCELHSKHDSSCRPGRLDP